MTEPIEYTPTTEEVREYVAIGGEPRPWLSVTPAEDDLRGQAFDRWLTAHDLAVRVDEREQCAQIADYWGRENEEGGYARSAFDVAAAIRGRQQ